MLHVPIQKTIFFSIVLDTALLAKNLPPAYQLINSQSFTSLFPSFAAYVSNACCMKFTKKIS